MPRGGRRAGAGRKSNLGELGRLRIGAKCEARWQALKTADKQAQERRFIEDDPYLSAVLKLHQMANAIPQNERAAFLKSQEGDDYLSDIRSELQLRQGIPEDAFDDEDGAGPEPNRVISIPIRDRRPQGERENVMSAVERELAEQGIVVSIPTIKLGWKEFRALQKRVAGETEL